MIFYGKPNELVKIMPKRPNGKIKYIRFDDKGELRIDDEKIEKRMKRRFDYGEIPPLRIDDKDITIDELNDYRRQDLYKIAVPFKIKDYWTYSKKDLIAEITKIYNDNN